MCKKTKTHIWRVAEVYSVGFLRSTTSRVICLQACRPPRSCPESRSNSSPRLVRKLRMVETKWCSSTALRHAVSYISFGSLFCQFGVMVVRGRLMEAKGSSAMYYKPNAFFLSRDTFPGRQSRILFLATSETEEGLALPDVMYPCHYLSILEQHRSLANETLCHAH